MYTDLLNISTDIRYAIESNPAPFLIGCLERLSMVLLMIQWYSPGLYQEKPSL